MGKTLYLSLKSQWYEMIDSGVKTEEYREIKGYWVRRLLEFKSGIGEFLKANEEHDVKKIKEIGNIPTDVKPKDYDTVRFSYGYTKRTMEFKIESITIGNGNKEWGAPEDKVFIIKLGERI